jgi:hypothetical protein
MHSIARYETASGCGHRRTFRLPFRRNPAGQSFRVNLQANEITCIYKFSAINPSPGVRRAGSGTAQKRSTAYMLRSSCDRYLYAHHIRLLNELGVARLPLGLLDAAMSRPLQPDCSHKWMLDPFGMSQRPSSFETAGNALGKRETISVQACDDGEA